MGTGSNRVRNAQVTSVRSITSLFFFFRNMSLKRALYNFHSKRSEVVPPPPLLGENGQARFTCDVQKSSHISQQRFYH